MNTSELEVEIARLTEQRDFYRTAEESGLVRLSQLTAENNRLTAALAEAEKTRQDIIGKLTEDALDHAAKAREEEREACERLKVYPPEDTMLCFDETMYTTGWAAGVASYKAAIHARKT